MKLILPNIQSLNEQEFYNIFNKYLISFNNDKIEIFLDENLDYNNKLKIVNNVLKIYEDYFYSKWENPKTCICLEVLANYLCHVKNKRSKKILSKNKINDMEKGNKYYSNFSNLTNEQKTLLGLIDVIEEDYD